VLAADPGSDEFTSPRRGYALCGELNPLPPLSPPPSIASNFARTFLSRTADELRSTSAGEYDGRL